MASAKVAAQVAGAVQTNGAGGMDTTDPTRQGGSPVIKRAIIFWGIAMVILFATHVGGSVLEGRA